MSIDISSKDAILPLSDFIARRTRIRPLFANWRAFCCAGLRGIHAGIVFVSTNI